MALDIDAFAVLRTITRNPAVFIEVRAEAAKLAGGLAEKVRGLVVKQVKSKNSSLASIGEIRDALGSETFGHIVDTLKDAELKALVTRFDRHNPEQKDATAAWRRTHLRALVNGQVQPVPKAPRAAKRTLARGIGKKKKPDADEFLFDESAGVVRKR